MIIIQVVLAFMAALAFAVLFNVPREELVFIGAIGALGWFCYLLCAARMGADMSTFVASAAVVVSMRFLSPLRKMPTTVFLIGGLIPLVPGAGIYNTMFALISADPSAAFQTGVNTLKLFGILCIAVIIGLSLPGKLFMLTGQRRKL